MKRKSDYVSPFAPLLLQEFHHYYGLIRHSPEDLVFALPRRAYGFPFYAFGEFPLFRKRAWFKVTPSLHRLPAESASCQLLRIRLVPSGRRPLRF
jgi:hypothetical protein